MIRKLFDWRVFLLLAVVIGYVIYKPEILPEPSWRQTVNNLKARLAQGKPPDPKQVTTVIDEAKDKVLGLYTTIQQEERIPGLPEQVVVDEYVGKLSDEVKAIPQEQLKDVKRQFCQDVIDEATQSASRAND